MEAGAPRTPLSPLERLRRFGEGHELLAIRTMLPWSFVGLVLGMAYLVAFVSRGPILVRLYGSFAPAFGAMSILLVVLLTWDLARRRGVPPAVALLVALPAFALSLPYRGATSALALARTVGSSGLFLAMIVAIGTVLVLRLARARFGARAGTALAAVGIIALAAAACVRGVSLAAGLAAVLAPLGGLGDTATALIVIVLIETLLWAIGIHGPAMLAAIVLPVYLDLQAQNTEALVHHLPLPHIVTVSLFLFVFPGGAGATLPLVLLLLRSRVKRVRRVAYASLVPAIFNANEPLMFGLPLILNPVLSLPYIVAPVVLAVVTYLAVAHGLVARPAFYMPSSVPTLVSVFLATKDWRACVLVVVNVLLAAAIYAPFVAAYERAELRREAAQA
ncbi:MAG: PTS transporter subunit EIIC [Candidatus Baltobacteraceae bacterium]